MSPADRTTRPRPQHLLGLSEAEYLVLWGVALHEAGHAVVAVSTGRRFEYVTIRAVEGIGAGHCVLAPLQDFLNVPGRAAVYLTEDIRKQVVCVLAGEAAGTFFGYVPRDAGPLADNEGSACRTTRNELGFRPFQHASMLTDYLKTPEKTRRMTSDYVPLLRRGESDCTSAAPQPAAAAACVTSQMCNWRRTWANTTGGFETPPSSKRHPVSSPSSIGGNSARRGRLPRTPDPPSPRVGKEGTGACCDLLQPAATYCSLLRPTAAYCSLLQPTAAPPA